MVVLSSWRDGKLEKHGLQADVLTIVMAREGLAAASRQVGCNGRNALVYRRTPSRHAGVLSASLGVNTAKAKLWKEGH